MKKSFFGKPAVVLAAGGNPTAIFCVVGRRLRSRYAVIAKALMRKNRAIEQVGFLEDNRHLQMAGGEFCGNATRAAALLIAQRTGKKRGTFTVSGFPNRVRYAVRSGGMVTCVFFQFPFRRYTALVPGGITATVVDLGGIVHVVLPFGIPFGKQKKRYEAMHWRIVRELGLTRRAAVGVVWREKRKQNSIIHPVVWVRAVNSYFYEASCGSGTIAVLLAGNTRRARIVQPTGKPIYAERMGLSTIVLRSRMTLKRK